MIIFEPISLYEEIRLVMLSLYDNENINMKGISLENIDGMNKLIELYKFDENFQKSIELKLSLKIFYFLKILTDVYNREEVIELFKNFEKQFKEIDIYENVIKEINETSKNSLDKKKILNEKENEEIKTDSSKKEFEKFNYRNNEDITNAELLSANEKQNSFKFRRKVAKEIDNFYESNVFLISGLNDNDNKNIKENSLNLSKEGISQTKIDYIIYLFLNQIMRRIQIKTEGGKTGRDFSLFVIPPLCLLLRS